LTLVPPSAFKISDPNTYWTPVQVYQVSTSVGEKTCAQFRADIGSHSLPPLVALANDGSWFSSATALIVNARYTHRRYVVDEALDHFALISGVGSDQEKVEVTRSR
jgi:type IV secretion system protein VirB9